MKLLSDEEIFQNLKSEGDRRDEADVIAMYSSVLGGITKNRKLMTVPVEDHLVHRGDGVFEAFLLEPNGIYDFDAHIDRLYRSAELIELDCGDYTKDKIAQICFSLKKATNLERGGFRLYLSRGPGGFGVNPYDCEKSQLYIILTSAKDSKKEKYENGVSSAFSKRVFKEPPYVWIKSCNYLANALMKKEAVDRGLELVIARNKDGVVLEGAVENVVIVTSDRELWIPSFDKTLSGTTVKRAIFHAKKLIPTALKNVCQKDFYHQDIKSAREFLAIGTTTKVLPIVRFEGENVGNGEVGPIAKQLASLIEEERAGTSCHYIFQ